MVSRQVSVSAETTEGTHISHQGNLKRSSEHHLFDSKTQPRDRLRHMTVRDAVREQGIRRAHSLQHSPTRQDVGSSVTVSKSVSFARFSFSPSLPGITDGAGSSALPQLRCKHRSEPAVIVSVKNSNSSFSRVESDNVYTSSRCNESCVTSCADYSTQGKRILHRHARGSGHPVNEVANSFSEQQRSVCKDGKVDNSQLKDDICDKESKEEINLSMASPGDSRGATTLSTSSMVESQEQANKSPVQRTDSMRKFLQLRENTPSFSSRARRVSPSNDSGMTSNDTSPHGSFTHRHTRQPSCATGPQEERVNSNIIDKVPISSTHITVPGVPSQDVETEPLRCRDVIKLDVSTPDDSSVFSSPQVDSMSSSVRSSDQGYVASGSDEDISFNTPPEEAQSTSSPRQVNLPDNISPVLLKKLLEHSKQEQDKESIVDSVETEGVSFISETTESVMNPHPLPRQLFNRGQIMSDRKYASNGIRRSKSNVGNCRQSPNRMCRQDAMLVDTVCASKSIASKSAENIQMSPHLDRGNITELEPMSAASTATLTNQDDISSCHGDQRSSLQSDHNLVLAVEPKTCEKSRLTPITDVSDFSIAPAHTITQETLPFIIAASSAAQLPAVYIMQGKQASGPTPKAELSSSLSTKCDSGFSPIVKIPSNNSFYDNSYHVVSTCGKLDNSNKMSDALHPAATKTASTDRHAVTWLDTSKHAVHASKNDDMTLPVDRPCGQDQDMHSTIVNGESVDPALDDQTQIQLKTESFQLPLKNKGVAQDKNKQRNSKFTRNKEREVRGDDMIKGRTDHVKPQQNDGTSIFKTDKECQTSDWLLNTLPNNKTSKLKQLIHSFSKKKQLQDRRESSASYKFTLRDHQKIMEAFPTSSLRDIHNACANEPDFTLQRETDIFLPPLTDRHSGNTISGRRRYRIEDPNSDLLANESELNFRTLGISKETDIIEDDLHEQEMSQDHVKKQLRFEPLPLVITMGSDEHLEPLSSTSFRRLRQRRESTFRERKRQCAHCCKKCIAFLFSHIGLCTLVVAYTILGGFIFQTLENKAEYTVRRTVSDQREKFVRQLISLAVQLDKSERGIDNLTTEINSTVLEYQGFIYSTTKDRGWDGIEGADEEGLWTFASSLLYAVTVTTTIGYGHVSPKTPEGRLATIGYAVLGIPLTLLCLTNIGDVMATGFRLLYGKICCGVCCTPFRRRRSGMATDVEKGQGDLLVTTVEQETDQSNEPIKVPTSLCLLLIAGYILAGALLFSMWESWDMLTGSYFCFITLSTIGFGDIVPGMDSKAWAAEEKLVLCALYLVLGLSLIAMCFNLVQEDVKAKCRWLGMKLGIVEKHVIEI